MPADPLPPTSAQSLTRLVLTVPGPSGASHVDAHASPADFPGTYDHEHDTKARGIHLPAVAGQHVVDTLKAALKHIGPCAQS